MSHATSIHQLDATARARLQSQVTISSFGAAVREVLQNSIDANATDIEIKLDLASLAFVIQDNGHGLRPQELAHICQRYYTSKLFSLDQLGRVKTFGFRGEALHSLSTVSNLSIVSRAKDNSTTYAVKISDMSVNPNKVAAHLDDASVNPSNKVATPLDDVSVNPLNKVAASLDDVSVNPSNKVATPLDDVSVNFLNKVVTPLDLDDALVNPPSSFLHVDPFRSSGTAIAMTQLFKDVPVRRNRILNSPHYSLLHEVKEAVFQSLVSHPEVRVNLWIIDKESQTSKQVLHVGRSPSASDWLAHLLVSVYGSSLLPQYEAVHASYQNFRLNGVIGLHPIQSRLHQYTFINGRSAVLADEDVNKINKMFTNCNFGEVQSKIFSSSAYKAVTSVGKPFSKSPVFVMNFECPVVVSDLLQDPSKTIVHAKQWHILFKMLQKVFVSFLRQQGYDLQINRKIVLSPSPSPTKRKASAIEKRDPGEIPPPFKLHSALSRFVLSSNSKEGQIRPNETGGLLQNTKDSGYFRRPLDIETTEKSANAKQSQITPRHRCHDPQLREESIRKLGDTAECTDTDHFRNLDKMQVTKESLHEERCRVIKQLYKKFILVVIEAGERKNLLVIDQHACDERIRVEQLFKSFIAKVADPGVDLRTELIQPFEFEVSGQEAEMLSAFKENFVGFGIDFKVSISVGVSRLTITHLPSLLYEKVGRDGQFLRSGLLQHVYDLSQQIKSHRFTAAKGNEVDWFARVRDLPGVLVDVINSKACRSAIMFGDELTGAEMIHLVRQLHVCEMPFQCAHGRPTTVPLANM